VQSFGFVLFGFGSVWFQALQNNAMSERLPLTEGDTLILVYLLIYHVNVWRNGCMVHIVHYFPFNDMLILTLSSIWHLTKSFIAIWDKTDRIHIPCIKWVPVAFPSFRDSFSQ